MRELAHMMREVAAEITGRKEYLEHPIEEVSGESFYGPGYEDCDRRVPDVRKAEGRRLLERVARGSQIVALTRTGDAWSSEALSKLLQDLAVQGGPDQAFLIGGALGLPDSLLRSADRRLQLSSFTLPHDVARLLLAEQLYRAGAIARGEPYHKGTV